MIIFNANKMILYMHLINYSKIKRQLHFKNSTFKNLDLKHKIDFLDSL